MRCGRLMNTFHFRPGFQVTLFAFFRSLVSSTSMGKEKAMAPPYIGFDEA